jgi:hypothetical protein
VCNVDTNICRWTIETVSEMRLADGSEWNGHRICCAAHYAEVEA